MQAIILAGGFGTRLSGVVQGVPKPMAPVGGKPFLHYLLDYLQSQGVEQAVICLHHMAEKISDHFGAQHGNIKLQYVVEHKPLGTGGGIAHAIRAMQPGGPVFALNGDSIVALDYQAMLQHHRAQGKPLTLGVREVESCHRYSHINIFDEQIATFDLLGGDHPGLISTGVYVIDPALFDPFLMPEVFSFERDFLVPHTPVIRPAAFATRGYFLDIGVPEDYARAQLELPGMVHAQAA